uniref:NADH dehydrogenase subunit 6 n=1 Tax=Balta jinlinorum TaxID=1928763 RepID=UPI0027A74698|nr:NADH dehydrogenase subunit 6 [Balta jinlinorum]WGO57103.1 NADH dehydrogenase subunit 6 [Balta jinlinorum]
MLKMMMIYMTMTSLMFTQMNHPMTMGLMLLLMTTLTSLLSGMLLQTFWLSYVLMLVFLGGMMVLFIYVTSIASNEMIKMISKKTIIMITMTMMITSLMINYYPIMENQETTNIMMINTNTLNSLLKLYNNSTSYITTMMATYLFITLIAIVKITNIFSGPLRKMNN